MEPQFAICNELFEGWPWPRLGAFLKAAGYAGIEIAPFTLSPRPPGICAAERREIREIIESAGLRIVGLHWLLAKTQGLHLTSPDPSIRKATAEYLAGLAVLCRDLGGEIMVLGSPQQRNLAPGQRIEEGIDAAADTLAQILPVLEEARVSVCLEPLGPNETNFLNSLAEAEELRQRLAHPQVRLHLDVKAMASESEPIATLISRHAANAGHFHANDPNRRGPGFGDCDFTPIFAALAASPYRGWVSVEVFDFSPDPETIAVESIRYMRRCWPVSTLR